MLQPSRLVGGYAWDDLRFASYPLAYTLNAEDYLSPRLEWTYYTPPTVSSLQPADGPAAGGHTVTVRGIGFERLPSGGAGAARCRFGEQVTRVIAIRNDSYLICDAPSDRASYAAALAAPLPVERGAHAALGIGDDAVFELKHAGRHCCAVGASAARVGGGSGYNSRSMCEAGCVEEASCRFLSYSSALSACDMCSSCTADAAYAASPLSANGSEASQFDSYTRVEPALPALMPFALSLNGQQYELSDADWTAELGYVMYAASVYNLSIAGGPTTGGTLVTITGRGFARAGARPASAPRRYGTLWWHRNASVAARCRFTLGVSPILGELGSTTPIQLRDDEIVCPTPHVPRGAADPSTGTLVVGLTLALNAMHYDGYAPRAASSGAVFGSAHFEGALSAEVPVLGVPFNLTLYEQQVSSIYPPAGPTLGGTVVRVDGIGLRRFAPHAAACKFGIVPSDADLGGGLDGCVYGARRGFPQLSY